MAPELGTFSLPLIVWKIFSKAFWMYPKRRNMKQHKNKLYIYTREKNTSFDRRFLMKRVGEGWMIDAVQERLNGWQRTGL